MKTSIKIEISGFIDIRKIQQETNFDDWSYYDPLYPIYGLISDEYPFIPIFSIFSKYRWLRDLALELDPNNALDLARRGEVKREQGDFAGQLR